MDTERTVRIFKELFKGNPNAYGEFIYTGNLREDGKKEGKAKTIIGTLTESRYKDHLDGKVGLGICPVDQSGNVTFTAIDFDEYTDDNQLVEVINFIYDYDLPLIPFNSKSGGLHLYTFYKEPTAAVDAIEVCKRLLILLGLPATTEVFPKQVSLSAGKAGNWINLPYFGGDNSRAMIKPNITLEEDAIVALTTCYNKRVSMREVHQLLSSLPLCDAPPCLQYLYLHKPTENRNTYLLYLGVYLKAKYGDDFVEYLYQANADLPSPLSEKELEATVIKSLTKYNYTYKCSDSMLKEHCNKNECKNREYSIGDKLSGLQFEQLTKINTCPVSWEWQVNGVPLKFNSTNEIIKQDKFIELCTEKLLICPNKIKNAVWTDIVNNALQNVVERDIEKAEDLTTNELTIMSFTISNLIEYFCQKTEVGTVSSRLSLTVPILVKKSPTANTPDVIVFSLKNVYSYMQQAGVGATLIELSQVLNTVNAAQTTRRFANGVSMSCLLLEVENIIPTARRQEFYDHAELMASKINPNSLIDEIFAESDL